MRIRIEKWGDDLAVRLPPALVDALSLREGDEIELQIAGNRELEVTRDSAKADALARLRRLRRPLPRDFRFMREEFDGR